MNRQKLISYCLSLASVYEDYPFDDNWAAMRHFGNKKAFAFIYDLNGILCINLKSDPLKSDLLRHRYGFVLPAYHMNKLHWNMIRFDGQNKIDWNTVTDMIDESFEKTRPKTKKKRKEN